MSVVFGPYFANGIGSQSPAMPMLLSYRPPILGLSSIMATAPKMPSPSPWVVSSSLNIPADQAPNENSSSFVRKKYIAENNGPNLRKKLEPRHTTYSSSSEDSITTDSNSDEMSDSEIESEDYSMRKERRKRKRRRNAIEEVAPTYRCIKPECEIPLEEIEPPSLKRQRAFGEFEMVSVPCTSCGDVGEIPVYY